MTAILKGGLKLGVLVVIVGLVGCTTVVPTVRLSGVPSTITQGTTVTGITATATPSSGPGPWTFAFSSTCGGTFSPATVGPTRAVLTVTTSFDSTGATPGPCTLTVTFTHGGRTATDSALTTIVTPRLGFYYFKGSTGTSDSIMRLGSAGFGAGVSATSTCATSFPGEIECDDDGGASYTDYGGFPASGLNSGLAGNFVGGTEELVIHGYNGGAMTCTPAVPGTTGCALYRHNPGNNVTGEPATLPAIPPCTSPQTDAGTFASGVKKIFPIGPTSGTAWYLTGTLDAADTSDAYTFVVPGSGINPGDVLFIALNSTPNDYDLRLSGPPGTISSLDIDDEFIVTPITMGGTYTITVERFSGSGPYQLTVCKAWP